MGRTSPAAAVAAIEPSTAPHQEKQDQERPRAGEDEGGAGAGHADEELPSA
ncbi:hypothetical protein ACFVYA_45950 [Amycolatopsis sp. NPDC058278]|uniref:hypothetical protein n=1 Tax=Amycolatopsis sp. NPDC058278 TaxID=3346417 RepID=UPI0036D76C75